MSRARLPADMVRVHRLLPARPYDCSRSYVRDPWARPLSPYVDAASLWDAVRRGTFPAPIRGPWGVAWRCETIHAWRARRGLK
jgi:hypothetical protein